MEAAPKLYAETCKIARFRVCFGMASLDGFIEDRLAQGLATFSREEAQAALDLKPDGLTAALHRLGKRGRLASPHKGFFVVLRPEDKAAGAPDPAEWIDPLMAYLQVGYRVCLLRAAAFHGSTHQAAMVFQLVAPKQIRSFEIGRHRVQFLYQAPEAFGEINVPGNLDRLKTPAGYATVAGVEVTLLDSARYFHKAGGINGAAQVSKDIGSEASPRKLRQLSAFYEGACARRLGFLLERAGHFRQAAALSGAAERAKTPALIDPSVKPRSPSLASRYETDARWKLILNETIEVDA